ncbi:MAG: 2'-5' RNA ligase family protein [Candidatus Curtissbacteria bacterium]|nr:2'-5' RNA ligase family protein [Candidatus Curtissbacteria bacterium]
MPSKSTANLTISQSKKLGKEFPVNFTLESGKRNPHVTLYQLELPVDNVEKVVDVLSKITDSTIKLKVKLNKKTNHQNFIFWACQKTKDLQKLHEEIVKAVNPLRQNLLLPELKNTRGLNAKMKKMVKDYGYTLVYDEFLPHITISNVKNIGDIPSIMKSLKLEEREEIFDTLALTTLGPFGTVPKILKKFKLS